MRKIGPLLSLALCISQPACGDDPEGSASDSTSNGVTSATSGNTGASASSTGGMSSGETSGGETGETGETGAPEPTQEICDRYIDCVSVTSPLDLPAAQDGFGPGSSCWSTGPAAAQQCIDACALALEQAYDNYPEEPKCHLCQADEECNQGAGQYCVDGRCLRSICGDGLLQADEMCDGQDGCSEDCLEGANAACNPLSNVGCEEGLLCVALWPESTPFQDEYGTYCYEENTCKEIGQGCAVGELCTVYPGGDCLTSCDLNDPESCPGGQGCTPVGVPSGEIIDYLGYCA